MMIAWRLVFWLNAWQADASLDSVFRFVRCHGTEVRKPVVTLRVVGSKLSFAMPNHNQDRKALCFFLQALIIVNHDLAPFEPCTHSGCSNLQRRLFGSHMQTVLCWLFGLRFA